MSKLIKTATELGVDAGEELFDLGAGLLSKEGVVPFEAAVPKKKVQAKHKPQVKDQEMEDYLDFVEEDTYMLREERADEFGFPGYHASGADDIFTDGNPGFVLGSHVGSTPSQAEDRYMTLLGNGRIADQSGTTYAVRVDVKNPALINDDSGQHTVDSIADALVGDQILTPEEYVHVTDKVNWEMGVDEPDQSEAWVALRDIMEKKGYDGLEYDNLVEGDGVEVSWIPFREEQIRSEFAAFGDVEQAAERGIPPWLAGVAGASTVLAAGGSNKAEANEVDDYLNKVINSTPEKKQLSTSNKIRGFVNAYTNGATFGASNEMVAAGRAILDKAFDSMIDNPLDAHDDVKKTEGSWSDQLGSAYEMYFDDEVMNKETFYDENPLSAMALEVVGSIATGGITAKGASLLMPSASLATVGAATGLVDGAVFGFLDNDGTLEERFDDALVYGAGGFVLGGLVGKGIERGTAAWAKHQQRALTQELKADGKLGNVYNRSIKLGETLKGKVVDSKPFRVITKADKYEKKMQKAVSQYQDDLQIARAKFPDASPETVAEIAAQRLGLSQAEVQHFANQLGVTLKVPSLADAAKNVGRMEQSRIQGYADRTMMDFVDDHGGRSVKKVASLLAEKTHDRIAKVSPRMANRMRQMEMTNAQDVADSMKHLGELDKIYQKMSAAGVRQFKKELLNNNRANAVRIIGMVDKKGVPALRKVFDDLDKVGKQLEDVGYDIDYNPNYWPRQVLDYDSLKKQLGEKHVNEIQQLITKRNAKKKMSRAEINTLAANYMRRKGNNFDGRAPNTKERTIDQISDEMLDHYGDPLASIQRYIHIAHSDVNMKKMFNQSAAGKPLHQFVKARDNDPEKAQEVLADAINTMMINEGLVTKLDFNEMDNFKGLFASRFGPGRKAMDERLSQIKSWGSIEALGNIISTMTQAGDFSAALHYNGLQNSIVTAVQQMAGNTKLDAKVMGLVHTVDVNTGGAGERGVKRLMDMDRNLTKVLGWTQFSRLDSFAKNNLLNGRLRKGEQMAKANPAKLAKEQSRWFGDETEQLVKDLADGKITENTKLFAFNTLSDAQPVSTTEMPQLYLDHPNGRIFYTLKTFAVNQLNIAKKVLMGDGYSERSKVQAAKEIASYFGYFAAVNGTVMEAKDWAGGEDFHPEDIPLNMAEALAGLMLTNRYAIDNYLGEGDIWGFMWNAAAPVVPSTFNAKPKHVPVIGRTIDDWFLGAGAKREKRDHPEGDTGSFGGDFGGSFGGDFGGDF